MRTYICPTVTAYNSHDYRAQVNVVRAFAERIHLDFMDGEFAGPASPLLDETWFPYGVKVDLHVMYQNPMEHLDTILKLKPRLVIAHAEASGDFAKFSERLRGAGIKAGVALLPQTSAKIMTPALGSIDHVLVFSGNLGHQGGTADLELLSKVQEVKTLLPDIEIGWDGGVNIDNVVTLAEAGVNVLNVGGAIQRAVNPEDAYATLVEKVKHIQHEPTDT